MNIMTLDSASHLNVFRRVCRANGECWLCYKLTPVRNEKRSCRIECCAKSYSGFLL